jgi:prepilin-type N-terminal cleavage/methylation domain-containing protein
MPHVRRSRAFTLIELTFVVALVGILAVIATVGYRKWVLSSYMGEAHDMLGNIRVAEEAFRAENTGYLDVSGGLSPLYPSTKPVGNLLTAWGNDAKWAALNVNPSAPVRFGYAVWASNDPQAQPPGAFNNGTPVSLAALKGQPWFVATAVCDIDNDVGTPDATLYAVSGTNVIFVNNEGL